MQWIGKNYSQKTRSLLRPLSSFALIHWYIIHHWITVLWVLVFYFRCSYRTYNSSQLLNGSLYLYKVIQGMTVLQKNLYYVIYFLNDIINFNDGKLLGKLLKNSVDFKSHFIGWNLKIFTYYRLCSKSPYTMIYFIRVGITSIPIQKTWLWLICKQCLK